VQTLYAIKKPELYELPPGMDEAIMLVETGWTPEMLDNCPQTLLDKMLIYKSVRNV
jgi:hypothetical protein